MRMPRKPDELLCREDDLSELATRVAPRQKEMDTELSSFVKCHGT